MMRKKVNSTSGTYFSGWILLLFVIFGLNLSSCKNYDDDIDDLQNQINTTNKTIENLKALVDQGKVITNVDKSTTGLKLTFSDGTSVEVANGKDGVDGSPGTVITIGADSYWYIDGVKTDVKAIGTNGKDGVDGADGKDGVDGADGKDGVDGADGKDGVNGADGKDGVNGADGKDGVNGADGKDGSVVTIGMDGFWYIDGVNTNVRATGEDGANSLVAQINKEGTYYEIYVLKDGKKDEAKSVIIPLASQYVSSIEFVPLFLENSIPVIYAPVIQNGSDVFPGKVQLLYRINPAGVQAKNFEVLGLDQTAATNLRASGYIPISASYDAGLLTVNMQADAFAQPQPGKSNLYALVVKNLLKEQGETETDDKLIYSSYVGVSSVNTISSSALNLGSEKLLPYTNNQGLSTSAAPADYFIQYNDAQGVTVTPRTYFVRNGATVVIDGELFDVTYEFTLTTKADNNYFNINKTSGVVTVKNAQAAAIDKVAEVKVSMVLKNSSGKTITKTANASVRAVAQKPNVAFAVVKNEMPGYVIGNCNISGKHSFIMDDFYNAAGLSASDFGNSYVDSLTTVANPTVLISNGIYFSTSGNKINVNVPGYVVAGKYILSRTFTSGDGRKWQAKYTIDLKNPTVEFNKNAAYWDGDTQIIYGREINGKWSMNADLADGFSSPEIAKLTPEATCGTPLQVSTVVYSLVTPKADLRLSGSEITIVNNVNNYIGKTEKVKVTLTMTNGIAISKEFTIKFLSPIKVETVKTLSFNVKDDISKLSPYSGIKITNLATGAEVKPADFNKYFVGSQAGIVGTQVNESPYVISQRLGVAWTGSTGASPDIVYGSVSWDRNGVALQSPQQIAYDLTINTVWGETVKLSKGLKVTVNP